MINKNFVATRDMGDHAEILGIFKKSQKAFKTCIEGLGICYRRFPDQSTGSYMECTVRS
jgi:hypothetical protein